MNLFTLSGRKLEFFASISDICPLTELSAAVVDGPSNSDHVGVWFTAGKMLHRNLFRNLLEITNERERRHDVVTVKYVNGAEVTLISGTFIS